MRNTSFHINFTAIANYCRRILKKNGFEHQLVSDHRLHDSTTNLRIEFRCPSAICTFSRLCQLGATIDPSVCTRTIVRLAPKTIQQSCFKSWVIDDFCNGIYTIILCCKHLLFKLFCCDCICLFASGIEFARSGIPLFRNLSYEIIPWTCFKILLMLCCNLLVIVNYTI